MEREFKTLLITRQNILNIVNQLSQEQLLKIPAGFNNNILWNLGHCISAQSGLTYGRAEVPMSLPETFVNFFKKGSTPQNWTATPDLNEIKELAVSTAAKLREDYNKGVFKKYNEYTTSYGVTLSSIEDAICFNNVHEGLHLGSVMALRKLI